VAKDEKKSVKNKKMCHLTGYSGKISTFVPVKSPQMPYASNSLQEQ
jgi:hypothetical protein